MIGSYLIKAAAWLLVFSPIASAMDPFARFMKDFGKVYATEEEKAIRRAIFDANVQMVNQHNLDSTRGHFLELNEWADRRIPEELPLGLAKKPHDFPSTLMLQSKQPSAVDQFYQKWLDSTVPVSELPAEVDWRAHTPKVTTEVKNQGMCGSCWAFAATTVLESHIALQTDKLMTLSPQELVSCVTNPLHCGGTGGCSGATYELAFEHVMEHGIVLDSEFPYKSYAGKGIKCSLENATTSADTTALLRGSPVTEHEFIDGAVATIQGYINLPQNNYTALMNAVATLGPVGVTAAASRWALYGGGVFDLKDHNSSAATDMNHAVVLEGYGIDQETQEPYWLVRNSWGPSWGENGYIRLKRVDPSTVPDFDKDDCGIDTTPSDGAACTKDKDGNDIVPEPMKVCGTTGILYDSFVPIGGRLLSNGATTVQLQQ